MVAPPAGARIRTRLRLNAADEAVVRTVGEHLAHLAGVDLAWRCRLGRRGEERGIRKRALTIESSSRWAGSITRTSRNQWERGLANLENRRAFLRRATRTIDRRLAIPVGQREGRLRGYTTQAERFAKQSRLQHLQVELAKVDARLAAGQVSVCRGGRRLAKLRHSLDEAKLTKSEWRARWQAERLFLVADGEANKPWGNETIRVNPDQQWLELRLPNPLAQLSNTPGRATTYRLACPVSFTHRADEWKTQAATGAVRYDIGYDPVKDRWYLDASWQRNAVPSPVLEELRRHPLLGVDLNAGQLACWVLDQSGNAKGPPHTIPLQMDGLSATKIDGRLRAAVAAIIRLATISGCRSIVIEDLDFTDVRQVGRETLGRGRRGKSFRRVIAGIPTRRFRTMLVGMAAIRGLSVIAVDPAWTSKWGKWYWLTPLAKSTKSPAAVTVHHAAAVVIARRGLGLRARRRQGVPGYDQRIVAGKLPARPVRQSLGRQGPGPPEGQRAATAARKTRSAKRTRLGNQVIQDRLGSPEQDGLLLSRQKR